MKKKSTIVNEKKCYEIGTIIGDVAIIYRKNTEGSGLLNVKTNEIIAEIDECHTIEDEDGKWFVQEKAILKTEDDNSVTETYYGTYFVGVEKVLIRIYDALEGKMIVDGWELEKVFYRDSYVNRDLIVLKSPTDGKLHFFDKCASRTPHNIFDKALDNVERLSDSNDMYYVVTIGSKKGLYHYKKYSTVSESKLVAPIEFDDVTKAPNIVIFTKNGKKSFAYDDSECIEERSEEFDSITIASNNSSIIYCQKKNEIYVYHTGEKLLLFHDTTDMVSYLPGGVQEFYPHKFLFRISKNNFVGLIKATIDVKEQNHIAESTTILQPEYDSITNRDRSDSQGYMEQGEKKGIWVSENNRPTIRILKKCDKVEELDRSTFAFYDKDKCDIVQLLYKNGYETIAQQCRIISCGEYGLIIEINGKFRVIFNTAPGLKAMDGEYDSITEIVGTKYLIVEQNGKKGIIFGDKTLVPIEYDEITFSVSHLELYLSLEKEGKCQLAKTINFDYGKLDYLGKNFKNIQFLKDIIVADGDSHKWIYNYEYASDKQLIMKLPAKTIVATTKKPDAPSEDDIFYTSEDDIFYTIDGVYYSFRNGTLCEAAAEEISHYVTTYETDIALFEISSNNKEEHDAFCAKIDALDDITAEQTLDEIISGKKDCGYPTLTLRKIEK